MAWKDIVLRLRALFFRRQADRDLQDELRFHLDMQAQKHGDSGEAQRQARVKFGSVDRVVEECRDARGISVVEMLARDIGFAFRVLRKSPGFAAVAVITLALTICANVVVFGVLNGIIIRPLNLPDAESFYGIQRANGFGFQAYPDYLDLRDRNHSFEDLAAFTIAYAALDASGSPVPAWGYAVTGNYFDAMRIRPYLGRLLHSSDEQGPDSAPYVVLTYAYWQSHFGGDRGVIGRVVQMNKHPFTIIGVAPPDFRGTVLFFVPSFYVPIVNAEQLTEDRILHDRGNRTGIFEAIGHLKLGITPDQANTDLNTIGSWLGATYPKENSGVQFSVKRPGLFGFTGAVSAFLAGLMLLAVLILVAACANLGTLFAARAADRSREVALRLALGASRGRIVQQLFTEAVLISIVGGVIGLFGSLALLRAIGSLQPVPRFPIQLPVSPDTSVYLAAMLIALISGFLFGAVPLRQVFQTDPYQIFKTGFLTRAGRRMNVRDVLLVAQVAICAVLVTSSLVAVRGLIRSLHGNFGFEPRNALVIETDLGMAGYRGDKVPEIQKRILDKIQSVSGVMSAGLVGYPPLALGVNTSLVFRDEETDLKATNAAATVWSFQVSPGYFSAAGTVLVSGRSFTPHDDKDAPRVAVINEQFARSVLKVRHPADALGRYFKLLDGSRTEVVGIAEDGKYFTVAEEPRSAIFLPILQSPTPGTWFVVRSDRDPQKLADALEAARREVDPALPFRIQTWARDIEPNLFPSRVAAVALGFLGVMAATLSITGIFGLAAYSVSKRMKELGIRLALGAKRHELLEAALGRAIKLLGIGSAAGLILGILASRVLAVIVYQATPRDPVVLAGVVFAMALLGLLATWIPARRALSIDPLVLLREE
jgi:predicted permease